jgi:lactate dehydrogenase-like 2-hydroxyacid dehydrogenase
MGMARGFRMEIHYATSIACPPELEQGAIHHARDDDFLWNIDALSMHAPAGRRREIR